ncbi:MerR family transcriptional regulator [Companilactobacillus mishanensis]|uniref:MerR family transcriptional regulator n=1 Tax=Companilactobacillus mishanensis TaxID=2486008 RepID=UPI001297CEA5|nr:MerR family transcriptional regulator [Companilactobacillus mishanensis]MQS90283.1 MerR family transcriptional regulator [Companilactobacillus mishanensis]
MKGYYKIGDVAKYFHLSKETMRFYEDKKLIKSIRDPETGYRYFGYPELNQIKDIVQYKSYGFSLDKIDYLVNKADSKEIDNMLSLQEVVIQEKIFRMQNSLKKMTQLRNDVKRININSNAINFTYSPAFIFYEFKGYGGNNAVLDNKDVLQFLYSPSATPVGFICDLNASSEVWGVLSYYNEARQQMMFANVKDNTFMAPRQTVHFIFQAGKEGDLRDNLNFIIEDLKVKYNLEIVDKPFGRIILRYHKDGVRQRYLEAYIPISDACYNANTAENIR